MTRSFVREAIRLRLPQPPSSSFSPHPRQWVAHVVNIGSVVGGIGGAVGSMGEEGGGLPGQCVYAASKVCVLFCDFIVLFLDLFGCLILLFWMIKPDSNENEITQHNIIE